MDKLNRRSRLHLCDHCYKFLPRSSWATGKLAPDPSSTCVLCRVILATINHLQSLHYKPLQSYSVIFQRLFDPGIGRRGIHNLPRFSAPPAADGPRSENETVIMDNYTETETALLTPDQERNNQKVMYRTVVKPYRSATLCTRLPLPSSAAGPQMFAADSHEIEQRIQRIAQSCAEQHDLCRQSALLAADGSASENFPHPIRLAHLDKIGESRSIRLIEANGMVPNYVCVSHRWRGNEQLKTKATTIESAFKGIPFETLPKTFQHSAVFAQKLGIDYLWIDSLCIVQDDKDDWERQSQQMGMIFQRSSYTLAAIDAFSESETDAGLFLTRDERPTEFTMTSSFTAEYDRVLASSSVQTNTEHESTGNYREDWEDLSSRAWTDLEYKMKPRYTSFSMSVEKSLW